MSKGPPLALPFLEMFTCKFNVSNKNYEIQCNFGHIMS